MSDWLLSRSSEWTWAFLRDAPFRPREETLTESILTDFQRHGGLSTIVEKSSASEESTYGLDWAWAIETPAGWLNLVVQAKQIDGKRLGYYPELRKKSAASQAAKLIHNATMFDAAPVYVFYNSEVPPFGPVGTDVPLGACIRDYIQRQPAAAGFPWGGVSGLGVTIVHAEDVVQFILPPPYGNQRATHVNKYAMPWECLVCPAWGTFPPVTPGSGDYSATRIAALAGEIGVRSLGEFRDLAGSFEELPWLSEGMPTWASAISEGIALDALDYVPDAQFFVITSSRRR